MAGEENSDVDNTGEVTDDCELSPLGSRFRASLRGEDGGGMLLAGECPRLDMTLGRIRLRRLRSRELATRERLSSELGDSARRDAEIADESWLLSLSAPVSLSKAMDPRLLRGGKLVVPA
jgi:hypothetical protein